MDRLAQRQRLLALGGPRLADHALELERQVERLQDELEKARRGEGDDVRVQVVNRVRESLPEFAERNRVDLPEKIMDNLASWVTGTIPPFVYRQSCWADPTFVPEQPIACACTGQCGQWHRVTDAIAAVILRR